MREKMKHLLTVIIPVFNGKKTIKKSVESVLNQSYRNIEVLLIDDGSTDGSSDFCEEICRNDNRVKVIHQANKGVSSARNVGIDRANGDLIAFADSDDLLDEDMYELLIKFLDKTDSEVSACSFKSENNFFKITTKEKHDQIPAPLVIGGGIQLYESITRSNNSIEGQVWNKVWKRNVIGENRFKTDISMCEDCVFTWQVMKNVHQAVYNNLPLYHYYVSPNSSVGVRNYRKCKTALTAYEWLINDSKSISSKCTDDLINGYLTWNVMAFQGLLKEPKTIQFQEYKNLKSNCLKYLNYYNTLPFKIRIQVKAISSSFNKGKFVENLIIKAKSIIK